MLSNFTQKAYEICYAVFRLGDAIKNSDLKTRLEKAGLDVLVASSLNNNNSLSRSLSLLEVLVIFSQGVGEISYPQTQILLREIGSFNTAIRKSNSAIAELNMEELFQTSLQDNEAKPKAAMPMIIRNEAHVNSVAESNNIGNVSNMSNINEQGYSANGNGGLNGSGEKEKENSVMRQSAILDIMRQVQNCRIKDLVAAFPGVSERTLRYDLQKLCEERVIERSGLGGPGTHYQLKPQA